MRREHQQFTKRETELIAVGPENAEEFKKWWHNHAMPFIGIADPDHTIAQGLYGQKFKLIKGGRMPALAVVDKAGRLRFMHYADSMSDIPTDADVLDMIDELNRENP